MTFSTVHSCLLFIIGIPKHLLFNHTHRGNRFLTHGVPLVKQFYGGERLLSVILHSGPGV